MGITEGDDFLAFQRITDIADANHGGHVTFMKFTTGWKIVFGTPVLEQVDRERLSKTIPGRLSLSAALRFAIAERPDIDSTYAAHVAPIDW